MFFVIMNFNSIFCFFSLGNKSLSQNFSFTPSWRLIVTESYLPRPITIEWKILRLWIRSIKLEPINLNKNKVSSFDKFITFKISISFPIACRSHNPFKLFVSVLLYQDHSQATVVCGNVCRVTSITFLRYTESHFSFYIVI